MKKYFLILFFGIQLYSQNNLLIKENGLLKILNYEINQEFVLDTIMHSNLAGYYWDNDTLSVSINFQGIINIKKYKIEDSVINVLYKMPFFEISNFKALYYNMPNKPMTKYKYGNIEILIKNGMQLTCNINNVQVWEKNIKKKWLGGVGISGFGYQNPILSSNFDRILISYRNPSLFARRLSNTIEIEIKTGLILNVFKKSTDYSYSNNSELILYKDEFGVFNVFNRNNKENRIFYGWEDSFWLVKK